MAGVYTIGDIRKRCYVDEETGHWHWRGGRGGRARQPVTWLPKIGRSGKVTEAVAILQGKKAPKGYAYVRACACEDCVAPRHIALMSNSDVQRRAHPSMPPAQRAKISATMRARFGNDKPRMAAGASIFHLGG